MYNNKAYPYRNEFRNFINLPRNIPTKTGNIYTVCWEKLIRFFNDTDFSLSGYNGFGRNVLNEISEISMSRPYDYICHLVIYIIINEYVIEKSCKEHGLTNKTKGRKLLAENHFNDNHKWDILSETLYDSFEKKLLQTIKSYVPVKPKYYLICNMKLPDMIGFVTDSTKIEKQCFEIAFEKHIGDFYYYFGFGPARKILTSSYWCEPTIRNKKQHISTNDPKLIKKLSKHFKPVELNHPSIYSDLIVSTFSFEQNFEPLDLVCEYITNKNSQ